MAIPLILFAFILPIVTLIFNIIHVRRLGKRGFAIALWTFALWFLAILAGSSLSLDVTATRVFIMISALCVCASTFLLSKMGGFSGWKNGGGKKAFILLFLMVPLCASIGLYGYKYHLLAGMENTIPWQQRAHSFEKYIEVYPVDQKRMGESLASALRKECPDLETFVKLSDEDKKIYYKYVRQYSDYYSLLGNEIADDQRLADVLTFLRTMRQLDDRTITFTFDVTSYMHTDITPMAEQEKITGSAVYQENGKYIIVYYQNAYEALSRKEAFTLAASAMVDCLPDRNMPVSASDIDYVVVASTYLHRGMGYLGGVKSHDSVTYVCVYSYPSGELLGRIDTLYAKTPKEITRSQGDKHDEFAIVSVSKITECLKGFFGR